MQAIVAVYSDWGIGCGGGQPLVISEDRRHFRDVTQGAAVIVGRKTLADFPGGLPLPGRENIVLTSDRAEISGATSVHSVQQAISAAAKFENVFVIGGESVYNALFPHLIRIYVTKIEAKPHSDVFFANLDALSNWKLAEAGEERESGGIKYSFMVYERVEEI